MSESPDHVSTNRPVFPWVIVVLVVLLAAGGFFWMNQKIEALQAAATVPHQDANSEQTRQAVAGLQQAVQGVQSSQQKLDDQIADIQRRLASEGGERKLISDQLSALSARVDALSSANAQGTSATPRAKRGSR